MAGSDARRTVDSPTPVTGDEIVQASDEGRIARVESHHALSDLFVAVPRGDRPRRLVEITLRDEKRMRFAEYWRLGADDQTVFLSILALMTQDVAHRDRAKLPIKTVRRENRVEKMDAEGEAVEESMVYVATSLCEIARVAGWDPDSGKRLRLIRESLERLSHTTVSIYDPVRREEISGASLLGSWHRESDHALLVAVNPWLSRVFLENDAKWVIANLTERARLGSDVARLVHARLCALLRPGEQVRVRIDTLVDHIYDQSEDVSPRARRKRREAVRAALEEISELRGWGVRLYRDIAVVRRAGKPRLRRGKAKRVFRRGRQGRPGVG